MLLPQHSGHANAQSGDPAQAYLGEITLDRRAASDQPDPAPGKRVRSACSAVTTLTGTPSRSMRWARSRCNHREIRCGSVETMTSSYVSRSSVWRTASYGSVAPTIPCTCEPAAASSSGIASSSVMAASSVSGSQYGRGTRSVNLHGPRAARSVTAASSLGQAAVRCATMRMRRSLMMGTLPCMGEDLVDHPFSLQAQNWRDVRAVTTMLVLSLAWCNRGRRGTQCDAVIRGQSLTLASWCVDSAQIRYPRMQPRR